MAGLSRNQWSCRTCTLFLSADDEGYSGLSNITREVSAVTGACLVTSREKFDLVGGFDESFRVAFGDVVFCFDLHKKGYRNLYLSDALFIHHESKTRGYNDTPEKQALNRLYLQRTKKHPQIMREDPFYPPNLA